MGVSTHWHPSLLEIRLHLSDRGLGEVEHARSQSSIRLPLHQDFGKVLLFTRSATRNNGHGHGLSNQPRKRQVVSFSRAILPEAR